MAVEVMRRRFPTRSKLRGVAEAALYAISAPLREWLAVRLALWRMRRAGYGPLLPFVTARHPWRFGDGRLWVAPGGEWSDLE
jgi:hypothetical protein